MHHHRARAQEDRGGRIEQGDGLIPDQTVVMRLLLSGVSGEDGEHGQSGDDEAEVSESVHRLPQQASAHPLTPSRDLADRLLVGSRLSPTHQAGGDEGCREQPEGDQSYGRRA